jgi:hypothetical protein
MDWWVDLLTIYKHNSKLQAITTLSLISTLYKSPAHAKSSQSSLDISWQRILTMKILQLLCSRYYCPASIPQPNCQQNYSAISAQPPVQSSTLNWLNPRLPPFHTNLLVFPSQAEFQLTGSESESYVTTDGQPTSLSWNKSPIWGLRPDLYYCLTIAGLLLWGALFDDRMGLSFTIAAGPRQRSNFLVRVP